jgi:hypothetical protein
MDSALIPYVDWINMIFRIFIFRFPDTGLFKPEATRIGSHGAYAPEVGDWII